MTIEQKNIPAAGQGHEDNESFGDCSVTTAYLPRSGGNTRDTYATYSGDGLPRAGFISVLIPVYDARRMATGPQLVELNPACVEVYSEKYRQEQEERRKRNEEKIKRRIESRIWEEFDAELDAIEKQNDELQARVDAKVQATLDALAAKRGDGQ